ncbi:MAG: hypothetical protein HOV78_18880 [Hamadaea sp.]|nr:hypothetical protein [Hamadaea sp.]NUT04875.1 hypothetical protein [Hamadaea sp.]
MKPTVAIPLAVGVGYVLGRTHKLKLAILLGAAAAAGKFAGPANEMMQRGARSLTSSTDLKQLTEPGQRLMEAAKGAAMTALTSRLNQLSGRLTEGMPSIGGKGGEESDERESEEQEPEERRERSQSGESRRGRPAGRRREEPEPEEETDEYDEGDEGDEDEDYEEPEEQPREQARGRQPVRRNRPEPAGRRGR